MRFQRFCLVALAVILASGQAHAQQLSISFHDPASPSVHDIQWRTDSTSPVMVFGIENPASTDDLLHAWQLGLAIVARSGTTGGLQFNTATLPSSYLLDGRSDGLFPPHSGPADTISVIGDSDSLHTGVWVDPTGRNLLQVDFVALPGTSGVFDIKAAPDLFNGCNWFSSDFQVRGYANVPFDGGPVSLGTVTVVYVPEPSTLLLLLSASLGVGLAASRRRLRRR